MVLDLLPQPDDLLERYGKPEPDADWLLAEPRVVPEHRGLGAASPTVRALKTCPCEVDGHEPPAGWRYPVGPQHPDGFASPSARRAIWLAPGRVVDRFGGTGGQFLSDLGLAWELRALPPHTLAAGYHVYELHRPVPVWSGPAAACFGHPGGGVQHYLGERYTVHDLLVNGYLVEVTPCA
ncbi:hypothetical protein GCM10010174_54180 [Kutzneria viridogrisea]|uniref:TNT domain-containing protein n=2 Tax=Kutzneria TaxID=43356 RepID=W5W8Z6_9PSEU|nr:TNT domain-containing protein [Kutzneria albida]AHH94634.1 hypothetical protein KALB_1261 [Kutzneria albida DSM 43870]MBA8930302.1 hypothetical protein [Kutzneria viridogrisea]